MTHTSSQQDNPYAGQSSGSPITFHRRTTAGPQTPRSRSGRWPAPDHQQGHTFGIHPADEPYDTGSFDDVVEGADYPGDPPRRRTSSSYQPTAPSRRGPGRETARLQAKPTRIIRPRRFDRSTFVIWLCLALIVMVGGCGCSPVSPRGGRGCRRTGSTAVRAPFRRTSMSDWATARPILTTSSPSTCMA